MKLTADILVFDLTFSLRGGTTLLIISFFSVRYLGLGSPKHIENVTDVRMCVVMAVVDTIGAHSLALRHYGTRNALINTVYTLFD